MRQFFDNGFSECQEMQTWPFHGDGDARASNEMRFIPAVTDHIPTMHVTGDDRWFTTDKQVVGVDLLAREFSPFNVTDVAEPSPLADECGEQSPARMLDNINVGIHTVRITLQTVVTGLVLMRIGNEQIIQRRIAFDSGSRSGHNFSL